VVAEWVLITIIYLFPAVVPPLAEVALLEGPAGEFLFLILDDYYFYLYATTLTNDFYVY
jgi:hypothetical protein